MNTVSRECRGPHNPQSVLTIRRTARDPAATAAGITAARDNYETLIEQGIGLIHVEGIEKLSLRKVAKKVGVSATACYNHFGNIDDDLLVMWAAVHGLAAMANMKGVQHDNGDWGALTERILLNKVML